MADSSSVLSTSDLTPKYFLALVKGMVTVLFPLDTAANTDGGAALRHLLRANAVCAAVRVSCELI
jgi:hypothetical protein